MSGFLKLLIVVLMAVAQPWPGAAEDAMDGPTEGNPFTNTGALAEQPSAYPRPRIRPDRLMVEISRRDCRRLVVRHEPSDDVEYRPGVDVRGRPVAPAEADHSFTYTLPDIIEFDLKIDPLIATGLAPDLFGQTALSLGRVRYDRTTGLLTLDGQPLTDPLKAEIEKRCRAAGFLD